MRNFNLIFFYHRFEDVLYIFTCIFTFSGQVHGHNDFRKIVVESAVMVLVVAVIVVSFVTDLAYALVDPRLRRPA